MRIIGLTGHMGVGKDAAAALLSMVGYKRVSFADQVREEVAWAITSRDIPKRVTGIQNLLRDISEAGVDEVWAKPTSERMRRILQAWGTELRRTEDSDYWVKRAMGQINTKDTFVFTDVRFRNEVESIRSAGGVIWKIDRPVILGGIPNHISEATIKSITPDRVISNTGTLLDLAEILRNALMK